jgi:pantetheine-phosphate adenylyltransferase
MTGSTLPLNKSDEPRVGVYPGTFDPITNGHMDIVMRGCKIVDKLIIAVARNDAKGPLFSTDERLKIVEEEVAGLVEHGYDVEVRAFDNLLMHFVKSVGGNIIIRGLRAASDFEYEFQMAGMNTRLDDSVETIFLPASEHNHFIASRLVKEIGSLDGDISSFVSARVADHLAKKYAEKRGAK